MKISNDRPLKEVLQELIETYHLEGKLNEVKAVHSWENVVGEMIARHTKDLYIRSGKLFVKIDSPALKHELTYSSSVIIEKLNAEAGCKVVQEIVFL
jgi:predicted nucleic acid-binding Zn ribbon protein